MTRLLPGFLLLPAMLLLAACPVAEGDTAIPTDVQVTTRTSAGTLVYVQWETSTPTTAHLAYGLEDAPLGEIDLTGEPAATTHEVRIPGLPPLAEIHWRLTVLEDGQPVSTRDGTVTTAGEDPDLPEVDAQTLDAAAASDGYLLIPFSFSGASVAILSPEGYYVWWYLKPEESNRITEARPMPDGSVWINAWTDAISVDQQGVGRLARISADGEEVESVEIRGQHHDFAVLPDGTLTWIAYDFRRVGEEFIAGDKLVERAPDGTETDIWSTWDTFPYDETDLLSDDEGWTHANSIQWNEDLEIYVVSLRNLGCIVLVDRAGTVIGKLGGRYSDYTVTGDPFFLQHGTQLVEGGETLLVFDNGEDEAVGSAGRRYAVDHTAKTVTEVWSHTPTRSTWSMALGDMDLLPSGNLLVNFGSAGILDEVTPEGEVVRQIYAGLGGVFGYHTYLPDLSSLEQGY